MRAWVLILLMGASGVANANARDLASLLPAEVDGFSTAGQDALVDRDGLFNLIDGGAEVYRALKVRRAIERRYVHREAGAILVDVFDMGTGADAYGAYHFDMREDASAGIGTESEAQAGNLYFWKDRYFVSVVPLRAEARSREAVLAIGRAIAARIARDGSPPGLVRLLPARGLVKSQVHFFHDAALFERHSLLFDDNPLGLGPKTAGLLARYRLDSADDGARAEGPALILIRYPDEAGAARAEAAARRAHLEPGHSLVLERRADLLIGVADADEAAARGLIEAVKARLGGAP